MLPYRPIAVLLGLLLACPAIAAGAEPVRESPKWRDARGQAIPQSAARGSVRGFSGNLLVTSDADWQEKWDTPPEVVPHFTEVEEVRLGGTLTVLGFVSNPALDANGHADVACDFDMLRPDGSSSTSGRDLPCLKGPLSGAPTQVYLTRAILGFLAESTDPRGRWTVRITFKDRQRQVELPLQTSFVFK